MGYGILIYALFALVLVFAMRWWCCVCSCGYWWSIYYYCYCDHGHCPVTRFWLCECILVISWSLVLCDGCVCFDHATWVWLAAMIILSCCDDPFYVYLLLLLVMIDLVSIYLFWTVQDQLDLFLSYLHCCCYTCSNSIAYCWFCLNLPTSIKKDLELVSKL